MLIISKIRYVMQRELLAFGTEVLYFVGQELDDNASWQGRPESDS